MLVTEQLMVAIDFHNIFSKLWKLVATVIHQNIEITNNETHTGLEQHEGD